ncbi:MAG: hypothetical protein JNM07_11150 [Phycisphaerae bacterium]|nr:hypothetical protein [Phycisphaerae bacterium]
MTEAEARYSALYRLWQVYLHMRVWGHPEYPDLDGEAREQFTELVRTRSLFTFVEDCKRDVLRAGLEVPDRWLKVLCMARVAGDAPLPKAEYEHLGAILDEMYPMLVRLDPDALPSVSPTSDRREPANGDMPDAVRRAGASLEWVRRERPDMGPAASAAERYTREQYEHIREHGGPSYPLEGDRRSTVPAWDTWSRYVREYLRMTEGRVNQPRRGRTGRSVVRPEDLGNDPRSLRDND